MSTSQPEKKQDAGISAEKNENAGISDESIKSITEVVNELSENFGRTYERLNYPGFVSVLGALLVFVPLLLRRGYTVGEEILFVASGVLFGFFAACWISIQNLLIYKLQKVKQEIACRMLAIKVAGMGETQRAALTAMGEIQPENSPDDPFKSK